MADRGTLAIIASISLFVAYPAAAHPKLASSVPPANALLSAAPSEIRLVFNEPLEPAMSGVELKDGAGKTIETTQASVAPTDRKQLVVSVSAPLKPGTYSVSWHAVAGDTHRVKGVYSFTVNP